ncbi:MAG: hypothetical protein J5494_07775, partial [Candidatus Methanomethylophilaceae archaeon]|nr:hypothetical protein [Candidatus Methanomethylophilaceae archaeon]
TAASAVVGDLNLGSGSSDILAGDFTVNGNSEFGTGCKLSADNVTINGKLVLYTGVKVTVNGILNVPGELITAEADDSSKTESFIVKKDVNVSGKLDLGIINYVQISGDLNVSGTAVMGTTDKISGSIVSGNTSVASGGVLTISENSIWACLKDLNVDGTFNAGKGSLVAVGSEFVKENGTVAVSGNIYAAAGSNFTASNLIVPGTFTSEGTVVIGLLDSNGISTIDGTVDVRAGTFTMYRTVYINGSVLTENGKFYASKIYAGVNESIFGLPIAPASKVPVIGSGVSLTSSGVAYVSPAVRVNGAFSDFAHTYYYKGDTHYLSVYANPGKYSDKVDGKNRNIDSIYASADNAYVNGWRATKEVSSSAEAAAARVYSPYGTYDTVWLNAVYDIFNFKLYAADETATPMVGKVNADGSVVPLTLYKSGLNLYESPVNLPAGTYRVKMTYADGHSEEYIDNPMIVNGVRQSSYDFTFDGNPDNKETVTYLIQFSFEEEPAPIVEPDQSLTITDILLIILVIVIIIIAIVLILRSRRS